MSLGEFVKVHEFSGVEQAMIYLCQNTAKKISQALIENGQAHLVLSGGNSPVRYLPLLADELDDWSGVHVSLSDERWVPVDHKDSNQRMVYEMFIARATGATFTAMMGSGKNVNDDAGLASKPYSVDQSVTDVSLLGVGSDGHIASLFPGQAYADNEDFVISTLDPTGKYRLSLSPKALLNSHSIYVLACGAGKRLVVDQAREKGAVESLPLRMLLHQDKVHVEVLVC